MHGKDLQSMMCVSPTMEKPGPFFIVPRLPRWLYRMGIRALLRLAKTLLMWANIPLERKDKTALARTVYVR